jgi:hypothetical protein
MRVSMSTYASVPHSLSEVYLPMQLRKQLDSGNYETPLVSEDVLKVSYRDAELF